MKRNRPDIVFSAAICVLTCATFPLAASSSDVADPRAATTPARDATPQVEIEDVELFFRIYDAAGGRPTAEQLQRDYLDQGTEGLHHLAKIRNVTGVRIADAIAKTPAIYANARACMTVLPHVRARLRVALGKLMEMYPGARNLPVTIAVGRGKPVGIGGPDSGVQIGLEAVCATHWMNPNIEDRFVYLIAHEYAHVQQAPEKQTITVLEGSLIEGTAEFVAELIAGRMSYVHFPPLTDGREKEIESAFVADQHKTDISAWMYNSTADKPGDLGYWVGYRIAKAYYQNATDKRAALRELLEMTDPKAVLAKSGWYPGIELL